MVTNCYVSVHVVVLSLFLSCVFTIPLISRSPSPACVILSYSLIVCLHPDHLHVVLVCGCVYL